MKSRLLLLFATATVLACSSPGAADPVLSLNVVGGNQSVEPGDVISVNVRLTDLDGDEAAGFQAFLGFDASKLQYIGGIYTPAFSLPVLSPITSTANTIDLAAGINVHNGQSPVTSDVTVAVLSFSVLAEGNCVTSLYFRPHKPENRVTDPFGEPLEPLFLDSLPTDDPTSDLNSDSLVNVSDMLILLGAWGDCETTSSCPADLDCSGEVNVSDLLILLSEWT